MTDDLIETVARAIGDSADEMHVSQLRLAARAAIRVAAPLILDMAADVAEKNIHNFFNRADTVEVIRQLKERFQ